MRCNLLLVLATMVAFAGTAAARTTPLPPGFDPARHMLVSEVRPGMKGYGLSVFKGTKIERFDVEVLSILKNFNPKYDVVLIRCHGANLEHTGAIAGMSGSPIFLTDDQGRSRMIGAFAYGWPLGKDPVAGVQPIQYMLAIPQSKADEKQGTSPRPVPATQSADGQPAGTARPQAHLRWSIDQVVPLPGMQNPPTAWPLAHWNSLKPNPQLGSDDPSPERMRPLATPLMAAGISPRMLEQFGPLFRAYGLMPMQAGGGSAADDAPAAKLEPGSVLAVPLMTGDMDLTAIGTCTEVIGNRVWGFGHSFNNEGPVDLPMGSGQINAIIASLSSSFKLGSLTQIRGSLLHDQTVGVSGVTGRPSPMAPIDLSIHYADGAPPQTYHFMSALNPRFTPLLAAVALNTALTGKKDLPPYNTVDYDLTIQFVNGKTLHLDNAAVNTSPGQLFYTIGLPLVTAAENPFQQVMLKKITGTLTVTPQAKEAQILSVNVPKLKYRPGQQIKAFVTYRPFHAPEQVRPIDLNLPRDLPDGTYELFICDWQTYLSQERGFTPFRFSAENIDQVFDVLNDITSIRHDGLYVRLLRRPDGVAVGRTALPHMPSSRRQVLIESGRSNVTPFVSSTVKIVPTPFVMSGSAHFTITISREEKVEVRGLRPNQPPNAAEQPPEEKIPPPATQPQ